MDITHVFLVNRFLNDKNLKDFDIMIMSELMILFVLPLVPKNGLKN